ncbi:MAG: 2-hydroxyacyl-CoA dehydratase [Salinibacterium sp.]|nr:2-hydroxyacyl-CoA dehydratase [Salinibacterium sp.]
MAENNSAPPPIAPPNQGVPLPPTSAASALAEISSAARRDASYRPEAFVVGTVGQDVPVEIIDAAGAVALRLRGNPAWLTESADRYLGKGLDPAMRSLMEGILDGAFGRLDAIVISSDCDASQRLFYVLREMRRVTPEIAVPPVYLVDILHLPRESTARYNRVRVRQLLEVLERWTGNRVSDAGLEHAVIAHNRRRELQRAVMELRRSPEPRLSGVDALAVFAAADRMAGERYAGCLESLVAGGDELGPRPGTRIFVTGSTHDSPDVYRAIEAHGATIVGENHDRGELLAERDVAPARDLESLLDAIADRYQYSGPTAQRGSIAARAEHTAEGIRRTGAELLLSYVRVMDEAPLWDFAAQRAAASVPSAVVVRQPYGAIDAEELDVALRAPEQTGVNR